jgi:iron(III) transport system ATP-binding protein
MASEVRLMNLSKSFGETVAVAEIDLRVLAGEFFSLLGPSGCGKTTTLRMVAGFETPDKGSIHFGDRDMTNVPSNKRNAGMVFQNYALFPHMKVGENVAFGLLARRLPKEEIDAKVHAALGMVQLEGFEHRSVQELSGGEQQRVALARALVIRPDVLLLDEPLSNLDAKLRIETRSQLRELVHESGITTIYVTHDQEEALALSDRLAVIHNGSIQQIGTPMEIYLSPASAFVARFIGHSNLLKGRIIASDRSSCTIAIDGTDKTILGPAFSEEMPQDVLIILRPESLQIEDQLGTPSRHRNRWGATVVSHEFRGTFTAYTLRLFSRNILLYETTREHRLRRGEVTVSIPPDQVYVLPET